MKEPRLIVYGYCLRKTGETVPVYYVYDLDGDGKGAAVGLADSEMVEVEGAYPKNWRKQCNTQFKER